MPADATFAQRGSHARTDNKVFLGADGGNTASYEAVIVEAEYFYADARGKFVKNRADATQQRVKLAWAIDGSSYVLRDDFPVKFHEKSLYAARAREIAGARDTAAVEALDFEKCVGTRCIIDIESVEKRPDGKPAYWWTNVKDVHTMQRRVATPPPADGRRTQEAPPAPAAAAPRPAAQAAANAANAAITVDRLLGQIPLPKAQQIRAIAKWANLTEAQLATRIGYFSGNAPLAIDDVEKLVAKIREDHAA